MSERESDAGDQPTIVRHEEDVATATRDEVVGAVRAHKHAESERVTQVVDRDVEDADIERSAPYEGDSGEIETLPDGSVSIPVFEEQLVSRSGWWCASA